ncbi:MAG TPA: hypothetical protein VM030_00285 [Acidimicrobiales bacterium]|nr:hypothetical protein [Acidimicrobiales bacterium]
MLIEVVTFRARDGVDGGTVAAADNRLQTECVLTHQGFVRRTVGHRAGRDWVMVTFWWSEADAAASWEQAAGHPAHDQLMSMVDDGSWHVERYDALD